MTTEAVTTLERESQGLVRDAQTLQITDAEDYAEAGDFIKGIALYMRRVHDVLDPIVDANHRAHKIAVAQRDGLLKPAEGAKRVLGERMAAWDYEQARRRREADAAAQRERERLEREAAEEAAREQARLRREAEDRRLADAVRLEAVGDRDGAARLIDAPVLVPVVTPAAIFAPEPPVAAAPKVEGVSYRDSWSAEVTDLALLVKAVAAGQAPITLIEANTVALNGMARSLRGAMNVPGVRTVSRRDASVRS